MDINKAMGICFKNKVKIYPTYNKTLRTWSIVLDIDGNQKKIPKQIQQKEVNDAITKSYIYYANKL